MLTPTQVNLLEMAALADISATSYTLGIGVQSPPNCYFLEDDYDCDANPERKAYCALYINKMRVIACIDSGSDLTVMQEDLFNKVTYNGGTKYLEKCNIKSLTSFSQNPIKVLGQSPCLVSFTRDGPKSRLNITVVSNIPGVPTFLLGTDSLRQTLAVLAFNGETGKAHPELQIRCPAKQNVRVYDSAPRNIFTCSATVSLKPFGTKPVDFYLHNAAPVVRTDEILISSSEWAPIQVLPSKTDLQFDHINDCFVGTAQIANLTNNFLEGSVVARFEILKGAKSLPINDETKHKVLSYMRKNPPVREILPESKIGQIQIPTITAFHITLNEKGNIDEKDMKNIAGINKVSYTGTAEITSEIIDAGMEIPNVIHETPEEALNLTLFEPDVVPYIKEIFLNKHRNVVSLHPMDAGDMSKTLGYLTLRLIPGEVLPRHKRIFHLSPQDNRYLEELLEQFIRFNYMIRAPIEAQNNHHLYGMSAYLIPRKKPTDLARLIIDFSPLTTIIQSPPAIVPDINAALQHLKGKAMFSTMDMRQGYYAMRLDEQSRALTTFLTPKGAYQLLTMPTGAACSPAYFLEAMNKILNFKPVLDKYGDLVYEKPNKVKLERDAIADCFCYMDDVSCGSSLKKTYKETLDNHFESLERIVARLAFHNVKLNVNKCEFAKGSILYLGWIVSHDFLIPDPRRMEKIRLAAFPQTKKEMRSFLGLVNSIRRVISIDTVREMNSLTPLTSSKKEVTFSPTKAHHASFEKIKNMLLSEPLFCSLIDEHATKYMFVDACTTTSTLGCTLLQRIDRGQDEKILPTCLSLDNKVHRLIYDKQWPYQPCRLITKLPIPVLKPSELKTVPPLINVEDSLMGFTETNVHDSFYWCIISLNTVYGCKIPENTCELRKLAVKQIKKGILGIKMKDAQFNNHHGSYRQYLEEYELGHHGMDDQFLFAQALASATHRPYIFISTLAEHEENPIFKFNADCKNPPFIFGVHRFKDKLIFQPYFYNKNLEFSLDSLRGKVQIIAYLAKSVGENYKSRAILDLEVFSILESLHSMRKYISNTKCYLLTDSRVLYYLFHQKVGDSSVKIRRWVLKLISDYPLVTLHFIRTTENLADYLTRQGLPRGDLSKLGLKDMEIPFLHDLLPKHEFTLTEWNTFCQENPQYLTITANNVSALTMAVSQGIGNIEDMINPIKILQSRLERESILVEQKQEFQEIIHSCLVSKNFEYTPETTVKDDPQVKKTYILLADLLLIKENNKDPQIVWPSILIGPLLSYLHLIGHMGVVKMLKNMNSYYFPNKYSKVKQFVGKCYPCFLMHRSSRKNILGNYPIPSYPFEEISMDLAENLNKVKGYEHLLIIQDVLSDFIMIFPMKSKTSNELVHIFTYSILQTFNIKRVHSDNGPCFRNKEWLKMMAALNIKVVDSSANNPSSRGKAERAVQQVKTIMRKMLVNSSSGTLNWEYIPFLVSKAMNHTITPRTGSTPMEMVVGKGEMSKCFTDTPKIFPPHHLVKNSKDEIKVKTVEIEQMSNLAKTTLKSLREELHQTINKNRTDKSSKFKPGDMVFAIDRYVIPGNSRPLKTKFFPSPFVIIETKYTTSLIERIADKFRTLISNDDIKVFNHKEKFPGVPDIITKALGHDFDTILPSEYEEIIRSDPLEIPPGISFRNTLDNIENIESGKITDTNSSLNDEVVLSPKQGEGAPAGPGKNRTPAQKAIPVGVNEENEENEDNLEEAEYSDKEEDKEEGREKDKEDGKEEDRDKEEDKEESEDDTTHILRSGKRVSFA